jgi:hypothetical protein
MNICEELTGVWSWDADIPFPELIAYLTSFENNPSKNLKLTAIASNFYQYCKAYGLNEEQKALVKALYAVKQAITDQTLLERALKHITVFINDEYFVEEAILKKYGAKYKLRYFSDTHRGLGRPLTWEELQEPDFIDEDGHWFEAKMCWEASASKFESDANLKYTIDPDNFDEQAFLAAFNKLPQLKAIHNAPWCFCLVKKTVTFGYVVGIEVQKINGVNRGVSAKLLDPLTVNFIRANQKFI